MDADYSYPDVESFTAAPDLSVFQKREEAERLEQEIVSLAGKLNAANHQMLKLLAEFDELGGWQGDGIKSFAHWLNWKVGMGSVMAREKVRVARALADLPQIDEAFAKGEVSYSKVRAMTRVATPENEHFLLTLAEHGTAQHIEQTTRKYALCKRLAEPKAEEAWRRDRSLQWYTDELGMININARLSPEEGALVLKALDLEVENLKRSEEPKVDSRNVSAETFSQLPEATEDMSNRKATALTNIAERYLEQESSGPNSSLGEKYQLFVHLNGNTACIDDGQCEHAIAPEALEKLACDTSVTAVVEDSDGNVLNLGRKSRTVNRVLRHALRVRDGGCRFPGCHQRHYTDAHHIKHWLHGGETSMDNLITLCRFHHTQLHKGEYTLHKRDDQILFRNKFNKVIEQALYPQFPSELRGDLLTDLLTESQIDERAAASKWLGEEMDYQMAMSELFRLDED